VGPSSMNNLVGIKPSVGLTSRSLVIPISEHQDTVGKIGLSSPTFTPSLYEWF
jgi:amidase